MPLLSATRKTALIAIAVAVIICIILFGLSIYLNSPGVRRQVVNALNARISGKFSVAGHRLSLMTGGLVLKKVRLSGTADKTLATVDQVRLRLFWPALIWREVRLNRLILDQAQLHLQVDAQDHLDIVQALSPVEPSKGEPSQRHSRWRVRLDNAQLLKGNVDFQNPVAGWTGRLQQIELEGAADTKAGNAETRIRIGRLTFHQPEGTRTLQKVELTALFRAAEHPSVSVTVQTPASRLAVRGSVVWQKGPVRLDLDCDLNLALDEIQTWLPADLALQGRAKGRLALQGVLSDPAVDLDLEVTRPGFSGFRGHTLKAVLALRERRIAVKNLRAQGDWGDIMVTGQVDLNPVWDAKAWPLAVNGAGPLYVLAVKGHDLKPGVLPQITWPRNGTWQLDASLDGRGIWGPKAMGRAQVALEAGGIATSGDHPPLDGRLTSHLNWRDLVMAVHQCEITLGKNRLLADGRLDLATRGMEVDTSLEAGQWAELGWLLGMGIPAGQGTLKVHGQGPWDRPTLRADLLGHHLTWADWNMGRLLVQAQLDNTGVVTFGRVVLENQGSLVQGSGKLHLLEDDSRLQPEPRLDLTLDLEQVELADFHQPGWVDGHLNGRLDVKGPLPHLQANLVLASSPVHWHGLDCVADGRASWVNGLLRVSTLHLVKGQSVLALEGTLQWRDPSTGRWSHRPLVHARVRADTLRLEDFQPKYRGRMAGSIALDGPIDNLKGSFHITGQDLDLQVQQFQTLRLQGDLAQNVLQVNHFSLTVAPGQEVQGKGWYALDQRFELTLDGQAVDLLHIPALQRAYALQGKADLHLSGRGTVRQPDLSAELRIRQPRFKDRQWELFSLRARLQQRRVELEADLNFHLKAHCLLNTGDFNLQADFQQTDLTPYLALWADAQWSGHLSGRMRASGNWHHPRKIEAELALNDALLAYRQVSLLTTRALSVKLHHGLLEIPATRFQLANRGYLNMSASGNLQGQLHGTAEGRLPLTALAPFSDLLEDAGGTLVLDARAQGSLSALGWHVDLNLADAAFGLPGLLQTFEQVNGHVVISPKALTVEGLSGVVDNGRFTLQGQVLLAEMQPTQGRLTFTAQTLPVQLPDTLEAVINGQLTLSGAPQQAVLGGDLVLVEGTYYKDVRLNLLSWVSQTRRAEPVEIPPPKPSWMHKIRLNIHITHRNPFLVDNNLAKLEIVPDLKIYGTLAQPLVSGRAKVAQGELIYRRKSFEVKRGVVDFVNPNKIEPTLDILAQAKIRQWQVSLGLSGTPDHLALKLSSDPPESDNDILSLILLGRTNKEMMKGEGGNTLATRQMLAALVATSWGEDIKKNAGVDILELETGAKDTSDSEDRIQVTVGKRLSRRLTIKYEVESNNGEMVQRAISEYRFLEHLLASGFQDSKGDYGGELLFRVEFR